MSEAFIDAAGVAHQAAGAQARIVSLVPSVTELLFSLGAGPQVVGRTTFCIHPSAEVDRVPRIGGTKAPKLERLRALAPTHIIVNVDENRLEDVERMREFVPSVIVTHPLHPLDNPKLYRLLGGIFCQAPASERLSCAYTAAYARLTQRAARFTKRRVLYLIWHNPWMTVSRSTYISKTLALVNWHTVADDPQTRYPQIEIDSKLLARTDLVLFSSEPYPFKQKHIDKLRAAAPTPAPAMARIDGEMTSWYGSRAIEGLDYLRQLAGELQ